MKRIVFGRAGLWLMACMAFVFSVHGDALAAGPDCRNATPGTSVGGSSGDRVFILSGVEFVARNPGVGARIYSYGDLANVSIKTKDDGYHIQAVGRPELILPLTAEVTPRLQVCVAAPGVDLPPYLAKLSPAYTIP